MKIMTFVILASMRILPGFLIVACSIGSILCSSCRNAASDDHPLFELMQNTGVQFNNEVKDGKLDNSFLFRNFYNGGGVAIGDINNDGLPDIFFTSNMGANKLYLNKGNFKFEDVTDRAGFKQDSMWSTGVVMADINGDGWLDIYVCNSGHMSDGNRRNKLYINNHDGTFTESAAKYGLDISAYTTQVTFFDYDGDGDLDCFMIDNSPIPVNTLNNANRRDLPDSAWPVLPMMKGGGDHLYRNDNGHFTEVTQKAGIHGSLISFGLGALVTDINGDGYPDIYVSNDSYERDYLYINQGDGTFKDELEDWMGHISMSSMGTDMADINNDGYPDLFTTDMLPGDDYRLKTTGSFDNSNLFNSKLQSGFYYQYVKNCLQLNNKNGKFLEIANYSGVSGTDWSWGALMFDMDNDGYNDIYVCNGVNRDVTDLDFLTFFADDVYHRMALSGRKEDIDVLLKKIPQNPLLNKVYRNLGDLRFADIGPAWGFTQPSFSNGAAYGDLDNDGDLDLVVNNENGPAFIYKNNSRQINHNHYIGVFLHAPSPNTFAIGSKIRVYQAGQIFYRELIPSRGFQSSVDYKQIIGLGQLTGVDSLCITWPDGSSSHVDHPALDSVYTIRQNSTTTRPANNTRSAPLHQKPAPPHTLAPASHSLASLAPAPGLLPHRPAAPCCCPSPPPSTVTRRTTISTSTSNITCPRCSPVKGPRPPAVTSMATASSMFISAALPSIPGNSTCRPRMDTLSNPNNPPSTSSSILRMKPSCFSMPIMMAIWICSSAREGITTPPIAARCSCVFSKTMAKDISPSTPTPSPPPPMVAIPPWPWLPILTAMDTRSVCRRTKRPQEYGSSPSSCLYINDGNGHFHDIAPLKNPDIAHIGMVTSACWADLTGQGQPQLLIVGEWMAPRLFSFQKDHFTELPTDLSKLSGWWQTVTVADLNGDGKPDLVLGNIGENFYLRPDSTHPVKLWINDFDQNGITDKVLTRTLDGRDMPVFLKRDMEDQIPSLKNKTSVMPSTPNDPSAICSLPPCSIRPR